MGGIYDLSVEIDPQVLANTGGVDAGSGSPSMRTLSRARWRASAARRDQRSQLPLAVAVDGRLRRSVRRAC